MKSRNLLLIFITTSTLSANAGLYFRGGAFYGSHDDVKITGVDEFTSSIKDAAGLTAAVGYKLSMFRFEGEVNYLKTDISDTNVAQIISSGDYKKSSVFANAFIEIPMTPLIEPYLGVGVGVTKVDIDFDSVFSNNTNQSVFTSSADDTNFSVQFMAGLRFSLRDTISVYAGYRYVLTESLTKGEGNYVLSADNGAHLFELGVGLGF